MSSMETKLTPRDWNAHREESLEASTLSPNSDFYMTSDDAAQIMNPECFSPEISQFILDEKLFLSSVLLREQYECIVEVGCHTGHNAEWLSDLCDLYVGVDINSRAIERAKQGRHVPGKIEFFCAPVENLLSVLLPEKSYPQRKVVLFPFNLFGNFIDVRRLLSVLDMKELDVAMSNFNTKSATTIGRYNYYINCFRGVAIRVYDAEQGVLFKAGKRFQSIAFNPSYLAGVIQDISDYHGTLMPFSVYGYLLLLTK
jgi:SAM-dependent methyltransferase